MQDHLFYILETLLGLFRPDFSGLAGFLPDSASTYFFMALFVPSFVVVISIILYFLAYFLLASAGALALNAAAALSGLPLAARIPLAAAAPAGAYWCLRWWRARRRQPPAGLVAGIGRLRSGAAERYGAKAASLGELCAAGMRAPFGFAVSYSLFDNYLKFNGLEPPGGFSEYDEDFSLAMHVTRDRIRKGRFPAGGALALRAVYWVLWLRGGMDPSFLVRSSFGGEDQPGKLAPGQYGSFGARGYGRMLSAVRECWCTFYTERAYLYREKMGVPQAPKLSFLVQVQLRMDLLGTAAAANPATGHLEEIVVDVSAPPEDPRAVSEQSAAETFIFNVAETYPVPPEDRRFPFLAELAAGLRALAARCEGVPVVEWAWSGGRLYFLQFRPLAGLPEVHTLISSGPVEIAREPLTPMAFSMIESVRTLDSFVTGPLEKYMKRPPPAREIFRKINSRVYARFDTLAALAEFLKPDAEELKGFLAAAGREREEIRRFTGEFDAYLSGLEAMNLESAGAGEITAVLRGLNEKMQGEGAGRQAAAAHFAQVYASMLEMVLVPLGVPPAVVRALPVLEAGCVALRRADLLVRMAASAAGGGPAGGAPPSGVPEDLRNSYIGEFWYLGVADEMDPSAPRIGERPDALARMFAAPAAADEAAGGREAPDAKGKYFARRLRAALQGHGGQNLLPWDVFLIKRLYHRLREYATLREELRYRLLKGWALARRLLLELASREPYASALADPQLVFFLTLEELEPEKAAAAVPDAEKRRREFVENSGKPVSPVLHAGTDGRILDVGAPPSGGGGVFRGRAASAGAAAGVGRLLARPEDIAALEEGEIAVVETCSPWMSAAFGRASGIVALSGGVVSHLALAAREYRTPMLVGVRGVSGEELDGRRLEMDTGAETVRVTGGK